MSDFNAEEYKKALEASLSCDTCVKVPVPEINEKDRYIFISYSHKDYKKVYSDLADLYESDIPFWYDTDLEAGEHWNEMVHEKMTSPHCAGIIFYISENLFLSDSIQIEIKIACGEDDTSATGTNRNFFSVNLTGGLPSEIQDIALKKKKFSGTNPAEQRIEWLQTLTKAFPDTVTYLNFSSPSHKTNLIQQIGINFGINPNYNPYSFRKGNFISGNAVIEFNKNTVYEGDFSNGLFEGQGTMRYPGESSYEGEWKDGKKHGQGKMIFPDGRTYMGGWKKDKIDGNGKMTYPDGFVYEGEWNEGERHGIGKMIFSAGHIYEGEWNDNERNGRGKMIYPDGSVYVGEWKNGKMHGNGILEYADGHIYEGEWKYDKRCGQGKMIYPDGFVYEGEWKENVKNGRGKMTYPDGSVYEGGWEDGKQSGVGKITYPNRKV